MKICHFGHINKNHSPIKYTYLFPRQDSREMKIQRPKLKHCSHVYSDNKVFQSSPRSKSSLSNKLDVRPIPENLGKVAIAIEHF